MKYVFIMSCKQVYQNIKLDSIDSLNQQISLITEIKQEAVKKVAKMIRMKYSKADKKEEFVFVLTIQ